MYIYYIYICKIIYIYIIYIRKIFNNFLPEDVSLKKMNTLCSKFFVFSIYRKLGHCLPLVIFYCGFCSAQSLSFSIDIRFLT